MKNNKSFFASFALLFLMTVAGCGGATSSSTGGSENPTSSGTTTPTTSNTPSSSSKEKLPLTASETLERLRSMGEMSFSGTLTSKYSRVDDETKNGEESLLTKTYISVDEYYILGNYENGVSAVKYHYFKNAEGQLVQKSVDAKNQASEKVVTDAEKNPILFDETVANPFTLLSESDFIESTTNSATFGLKREQTNGAIGNLIYTLLAGYNVPAEKMVITFDDDDKLSGIQITGEQFTQTKSRVEYNYVYNFEATISNKEDLKVPTYPYSKSSEDMSKLERALELIKGHNYEMKLYSSFVNDGLTPNLSAIVTKEGFIVKDETSDSALPYGMIDVNNGSRAIIEVRTDATTGKVSAVGTEKEIANSSVSEYYPKADYSVDLFEKNDKGYVLLDAYTEVSTLIPDANTVDITYMFGVNVLTFDIADDLSSITYSYIFKGINGYGTRTVEMTNLGTAKLPFDISTDYVKYDKATSWSELNPTAKAEADELLGGDLDEILPFLTTEYEMTLETYSDEVQVRVSCGSEENANELISSYYFDLVFTGGFAEDESEENSFVKDDKYRLDLEIDMFTNDLTITLYLE